MADTLNYDVMATLRMAGVDQVQQGMMKAAEGADDLQKAFDRAKGGARQMADGVVEAVDRVVSVTGKIAAVAMTAATLATGFAVTHVAQNLTLLEGKSIQLGAVLGAVLEKPFEDVQGVTRDLFDQFRQDALASNGETQNFVETAALIAGPILGAGKAMKDVHDITKAAVESAGAFNVELKDVGGQVSKILQGGAGADSPLFMAMRAIPSLKVPDAEKFNALDAAKKVDLLAAALGNPSFVAAAKAAGESMTGLVSTTQDLAKSAGGMALAPSFGAAKRALSGLTSAAIEQLKAGGPLALSLSSLGNTLGVRANQIVDGLGRILHTGNGVAGWVGALDEAANRGLGRVVSGVNTVADHWPQVVSGARQFALYLGHAAERAEHVLRVLGGGDLLKGVERVGLGLAGAKVGAPLASAAGGALGLASGLVSGGKAVFGLMGSGAAGAAGAAAAGAGTAGTAGAAGVAAGAGAASATGAAGTAASAAGATAAGVGAGTVGAVLAAIAAYVAVTYLAIKTDTFGFFAHLRERFNAVVEYGQKFGVYLDRFWDSLVKLYDAAKPLLGILANFAALPLVALLEAMSLAAQGVIAVLTGVTVILTGLATIATAFATEFVKMGTAIEDQLIKWKILRPKLGNVDEPENRRERELAPMLQAQGSWTRTGTAVSTPAAPKAATKVEVTIKWDLGDGNDEAIFVRTQRQIVDSLRGAKGFVRSGPMPGTFR